MGMEDIPPPVVPDTPFLEHGTRHMQPRPFFTGITVDEAIMSLNGIQRLLRDDPQAFMDRLTSVYPYPRTPFEEWCMESDPTMTYTEWLELDLPLECERYVPDHLRLVPHDSGGTILH